MRLYPSQIKLGVMLLKNKKEYEMNIREIANLAPNKISG
jgi:hypothetical protein